MNQWAPTETTTVETGLDPLRWMALAVVCVAQLMIVVDVSIVNIALPNAQTALHISTANRQWIVTAYTLAFGGLLLLGGRVADYMGRKRVLVVGLLGFAASSAVGGLAPDAALLFTARAVQGVFAALLAPAALSLINVTFTDTRERAKAFGFYGAIGGGGVAVGLLGGGLLTQYLSWRWCLLVNTPIAGIAAIAALRVVRDSKSTMRKHYDLPGALTSSVGLVALVYGFTEAAADGWGSAPTIILLGAALILLGLFIALEIRSSSPLLPLRVLTERNRCGSFITSFLSSLALFGMFLFLTYYLQETLRYSPLRTGFAFLPLSFGIALSAAVATQLMKRVSPRWVMAFGLVLAGAGLLLFAQLGVNDRFWSSVFPAEAIMSLGLGLVYVPLYATALYGVDQTDSGVASALVNTTQEVGGSVGTALLNTIAASTAATYVTKHGAQSVRAAAVHGYTAAFAVGAAFIGLAAFLVIVLVNARRDDLPVGDGR